MRLYQGTMRLYQGTFSSIATLFHIVGHEGQHIVDIARSDPNPSDFVLEKRAYDWNRANDRNFPFFIPWPWTWPIPLG